jgi:hypothetical protein
MDPLWMLNSCEGGNCEDAGVPKDPILEPSVPCPGDITPFPTLIGIVWCIYEGTYGYFIPEDAIIWENGKRSDTSEMLWIF